ncbi:MAG: glycoside hydrolase family 78 protein [Eubacterium sp.]|nr:glycoside hydrolase family 78 protein [Eubacterium sp.]
MLHIEKITVDHTQDPVGVTGTPGFAWILSSDRRSTMQASYRLEIALDEEFSRKVFEIEEETERSVHHRYADFLLQSLTRYYWRVEVMDNHGEKSGFCAPGSFVTGLMGQGEWKAEFISAESEADKDNSRGTYLRKQFAKKGKVREAYVCSTALGLYQLYLNGTRIGQDEMTPGWTSYHKHLCYQVYDVTEQLQGSEPECCLGALLGAGWYKGEMGFLHLRNYYGTRTGLLCQLRIVYEDGSVEEICSDESWQGKDSPVLFSEIYDGEIYDARLETEGWCSPGIPQNRFGAGAQDDGWRAVSVIPFDKSALTSQFAGKVGRMEEFPAGRLFTTPKGELVADFGQNMSGWVMGVLHNTKAGDKLEIRCFETLDKDGNVYRENLRAAKATYVYYCKGAEREEYCPHFTYMGFRYAHIANVPCQIREEDIRACALYSRMEQTGYFHCSDQDLNQLWSNITWGLKSNFLDIPTDCPQRDERLGWTGDAQIFCRTASYIMDTYLFYEKWLRDVAADQTPEGGVPHVVPDIITPYIGKVEDWLLSQGTHSAAAWADVAVLNPWNLYLTFGDEQILRDQYESMKAWIRFMESHGDGITWNYRLQFGDWVALDAEEGSYYGATPTELTCAAYYAYSTGIFAKIAEILGAAEDAASFGALAERIRKGFGEIYFDPATTGMKVQTQTAHIIALCFGLTPEEYRPQTVRELLDLLAKENGHLVTGFVGTPYFLHALSGNGHLKEAYDLLLKDDFPSWLYQVRQGATTVWEHWDGIRPDGSMWSPDMNSFNHYAYGAVGEWMARVMAGLEIQECAPGYRRPLLYPQPGGGLDFVTGRYESQYGTVECSWKLAGNRLEVSYQIPANTTADIRLDHVVSVEDFDGMAYHVDGNGTLTAEAGSGTYRVRVILGEGDRTY